MRAFSRLTGIDAPDADNAAEYFLNDALPALKRIYPEHSGEKAAACTKHIGPGILKPENINICLERPGKSFLDKLLALAKENAAIVREVSAEGFCISLVGATTFTCTQDIVCDNGSGELAVMTGLVDAYFSGADLPSRAWNTSAEYHTVFHDDNNCDENKLLLDACKAYKMRDKNRLMPSDTLTEAQFSAFTGLQKTLNEKAYKAVYLLGGSSNLKLTQDDALCRSVRAMTEAGALCLAFGDAAVILGKHGFLDGRDGVIGLWGGGVLPDLLMLLPCAGIPCCSYFPELRNKADILGLLACAAKGIPAYTSTRLPFDGAGRLSKKLSEKILYGKPGDVIDNITRLVQGGRNGD